MSEDPNKKTTPENAPTANVEQAPDIDELERKNQAERMVAAEEERRLNVQKEGETLKTGLENRVNELPAELKGEAAEIMKAAQEEITQNLDELDVLAKGLKNEWFREGEAIGGGGLLEAKAVEAEPIQALTDANFEQTESKDEKQKQAEVTEQLNGLKAMRDNLDLPDEERAEIEEQIAGFEESLSVAEETGQTIYESSKVIKEIPQEAPQTTPTAAPAPEQPVLTPQPERPVTVSTRPEARNETPKLREELLAERRQLQREWEKEATKVAEQKISKEDKKKYQQLLAETGLKKPKKGSMSAEERKKFIEDLGFTDADYQLMKAGSKPWTLNAIWKRLGELDREIAEARPVERAPESYPDTINRPTTPPAESREPAMTTTAKEENEDAIKAQELADAARVLNGVLSKLDKNYADNNTEILKQINKDPSAVKTFVEQSTQVLHDWQNVTNARDIIPALVPDYGMAEDLAKLSDRDLEAIRQHTVDKLIESIRLAEHAPGTKTKAAKEPSAKEKEKNEIKDAMMSEIEQTIENAEAWHRGNEEEELEAWTDASQDADIKELLKEKLWPVAGDIKLLKSIDLGKIREQVIAKLTPIAKAAREVKPPEAPASRQGGPSIGLVEKTKEDRRKTLDQEIHEAMEKRAELRQAARRGEKGAEKKLRLAGNRLEKLRAEKREMKKK